MKFPEVLTPKKIFIIVDSLRRRSGEEKPYWSKKATWNLLNAYIYANIQRLIYECPGYGVQDISILQSQCANMKFSDQIIYNRMFQKVVHKVG